MSDQMQAMMGKMQDRGPNFARKALGLITLLTAGTTLLVVGGLVVGGTVIGGLLFLAVAIPVLIFFSPVLIPVGITLAAVAATVAFVAAVIGGISWIYRYLKGRRPPGTEQMEYARRRAQEAGSRVKERAEE